MHLSFVRAARAALILAVLPTLAYAAPDTKPTDAKPADAKPADAKPDEPKPEDPNAIEAQKYFKNGLELYKVRSFDNALVAFEQAYQLSKSYKVLFNIALVYRDMNDFASALDTFDRYFAEGSNEIDEYRRAEVDSEYQRLKRFVAEISITSNAADTDISVDDISVGKTPFGKPVRIHGGMRRKISAAIEGRKPKVKYIKAVGGGTGHVEFDMFAVESEAAPAPVIVQAAATQQKEEPSRFTKWSWAGVGAAGALAVGATITGIAALNASDDVKKGRFAGATPPADLESSSSAARALSITTDVLIVASAATLGTTLALTFLWPKKETEKKSATVDLQLRGAGAALVGSF